MPLITSTTQLNKWKFGMGPWSDKRDGGNSNQPYITRDIPGVQYDNPNQTFESVADGDLPFRSGPDFILRNGLLAPVSAARDVSRLTQYMFDLKSPRGLLFVAKQNVLSRTSVKSEASFGIGYGGTTPPDFINGEGGGAVNQGIYTPLSTFGQALGGFAGAHLNLLGLDPTSPMSGIIEGGLFPDAGLNTYLKTVSDNNLPDKNTLTTTPSRTIEEELSFLDDPDIENYRQPRPIVLPETVEGKFSNRLLNLWFNKQNSTSFNNPNDDTVNVMSYKGGPGSILGIGKTNIRFATDTNGSPLRTGEANVKYGGKGGIGGGKYQTGPKSVKNRLGNQESYTQVNYNNATTSTSLSGVWSTLSGLNINNNFQVGTNFFNVYNQSQNEETGSLWPKNTPLIYSNNTKTFSQSQIDGEENIIKGGVANLYPTDFRKELYNVNGDNLVETQQSKIISLSPNYSGKNVDVRTNQAQPGIQGGGRIGDTSKNVWNYGIPANELEALDKINAMPMYDGTGPDTSKAINDLVKFRIAAINNDKSDGSAVYMHFRAFLDSFSDSYNATWNAVNYVGRGDTLWNYGGFGRTVSLSFTTAAQSKAELIPMYKKLNYLASTLAPDYTDAGFMRGNLVRLTVGGYLYEQPGFITSLTYDIPQESPWEIGINADGNYDSSVKELPHMIKVSSFNFTPVHNFLPEKPNSANVPNSRFISLSNNYGRGNYNDSYKAYDAPETNAAAINDF